MVGVSGAIVDRRASARLGYMLGQHPGARVGERVTPRASLCRGEELHLGNGAPGTETAGEYRSHRLKDCNNRQSSRGRTRLFCRSNRLCPVMKRWRQEAIQLITVVLCTAVWYAKRLLRWRHPLCYYPLIMLKTTCMHIILHLLIDCTGSAQNMSKMTLVYLMYDMIRCTE